MMMAEQVVVQPFVVDEEGFSFDDDVDAPAPAVAPPREMNHGVGVNGGGDEFQAPQEDDPRMRLTEAERGAAILIKDILEKLYREDEDLESMSLPSDFMIAQFAIVSIQQGEGNPNVILERIQNLQHAIEEIQIRDTYEDGLCALKQMTQSIAPHYFLSFGYSPEEESYMSVIDVTKFHGSAILTNELKSQIWMKAEYYRCQAAFNDFESVRNGLLQLVECQDYDWRSPHMLNMTCAAKLSNELAAHYPVNFRKNKHYHTGMFFNMFIAGLRKLIPRAIHKSFEVGCQFDHGRLDSFLLLPTPEESNTRLLDGLQKALEKRYHNEATFSLQ